MSKLYGLHIWKILNLSATEDLLHMLQERTIEYDFYISKQDANPYILIWFPKHMDLHLASLTYHIG